MEETGGEAAAAAAAAANPPARTDTAAAPAADDAPESGDESGEEGAEGAGELSKNAQKRLRKQAEYEVRKAAKKLKRKEALKEKSAQKYELVKQRLANMTPEEMAELEAKRAAARADREAQKAQMLAHRQAALDSPFNFVVDCGFESLMEQREARSMVHQFAMCHSANMRAKVPARLCLAALGGHMAESVSAVCGSDKWAMVRDERSYLDVFADRRSSLVYLTADSPNELPELSADDVYIIGGIVDRNRHKGLTLQKAETEGIRHARLPIQQHVKMAGSHVLTVNQVMDLLLAWLELRDWRGACERAVPKRKRGDAGGEAGGADEEEEEEDNQTAKLRRLEEQAARLAEADPLDVPPPEEAA